MNKSARFVFLHLGCALRRPQNWRFHSAGIAREFSRMEKRLHGVLTAFSALF
jgi:hypothetical protein